MENDNALFEYVYEYNDLSYVAGLNQLAAYIEWLNKRSSNDEQTKEKTSAI